MRFQAAVLGWALLAAGVAGCGQHDKGMQDLEQTSGSPKPTAAASSGPKAGQSAPMSVSRNIRPEGETDGLMADSPDSAKPLDESAATASTINTVSPGLVTSPDRKSGYIPAEPESRLASPTGQAPNYKAVKGLASTTAPRGDSVQDSRALATKPAPAAVDAPPAAGTIAGLPAPVERESNTEAYAHVPENDYLRVKDAPLSTFSIDVDTASYANVRRFLMGYQLPPVGAVRLEELVNYFQYDYAPPQGDVPFAVHCESAQCPWNTKHNLLRIALKGKVIEKEQRPVSNLVFLLDVSGSMNEPNKLPLVKESLKLLVGELTENDRVAICVYAGAAGMVLPSTSGDNKAAIISSLDNLAAGGSTNGGQGIELAYKTAVANFIKGGTNRVILCTDGDFNVGTTSQDQLHGLIADSAKSGVYLSVLGFGHGNYKDSTMELLADKGNGNYGYIDTLNEGRKVFLEQMTGTLITIAKDVKIQVDFNPAHVAAYRLLGYENRILAAQDFKDDKKDAGEIGAGHTVTALYELVPPGQEVPAGDIDASKYQKVAATEPATEHKDELLTVRLRYKEPDAETSKPLEVPVKKDVQEFDKTSADFQFATAVVQFGMLLKNSKYKGGANWDSVLEIAQGSLGTDANGYRAEFVELVRKARELSSKK